MKNIEKLKLGELLVSVGKINEQQLKDALDEQRKSGEKLGAVLVGQNYITENDIIEVLEFQLGIPHVDLSKYTIQEDVVRCISEKLAKRYILIPIEKQHGKLKVAMSDPLNVFAIDDIKMSTGMDVQPVISTQRSIEDAIGKYYGKEIVERAIEDFKKEYKDIPMFKEDLSDDVNNAPVVRLVNSIVKQAILLRASDIHIEPYENNIRIRFRIDGKLQEIMNTSKNTHMAIVSRMKIMGSMDIAEKRIPQDGKVELTIESKKVDLRISTLPTVYGEKIVIRVLDKSSFVTDKEKLGFSKLELEKFDSIIKNPHGIILLAGPTGSGKTTTLYTILTELNDVNKNIITVEDPVEYSFDGINQVQVNLKAGLDFAEALKSILRQDPDVIMIGEIRDEKTAQIALRAAITGHLVVSTIHTNDCASTISRLADMGIKEYMIASSLISVISQRLVRKVCTHCKTRYMASDKEKEILEIMDAEVALYKGKGCARCFNSGYKGRIGVYEILEVDKMIRKIITDKGTIDEIRHAAMKNKTVLLSQNCRQLVLNGVTSFEEFIGITYYNE